MSAPVLPSDHIERRGSEAAGVRASDNLFVRGRRFHDPPDRPRFRRGNRNAGFRTGRADQPDQQGAAAPQGQGEGRLLHQSQIRRVDRREERRRRRRQPARYAAPAYRSAGRRPQECAPASFSLGAGSPSLGPERRRTLTSIQHALARGIEAVFPAGRGRDPRRAGAQLRRKKRAPVLWVGGGRRWRTGATCELE